MSYFKANPATRSIARGASHAMVAASHIATLAAVLALAWAGQRLTGDARTYLANAGGLPKPSVEYAWQVATSPGVHLRLMWWSAAWVSAIFGVGCWILAVAGARSLYWRLHGLARAV